MVCLFVPALASRAAEFLKNMAERWLVVGGSGYIGSHLAAEIMDRRMPSVEVVVFDKLMMPAGLQNIPGLTYFPGDLSNLGSLRRVFEIFGPFTTVFHLAGSSIVSESMSDPLKYFEDNVSNGINLVKACVENKVQNFVFSSSAAIFYGEGAVIPLSETAIIRPASPYGVSKLMFERVLDCTAKTHGMKCASLRYFNAAGCDPQGRLGENHFPETHLIPVVIDAALNGNLFVVNGSDYPTPDGTAIRDFVHVKDLADAHIRVLNVLKENTNVKYNLGTGKGYSVREVIHTVESLTRERVKFMSRFRRSGDPAYLVADPSAFIQDAKWELKHSYLDEIVDTTYAWRKRK